jgi:hypothetical protein
MEPAVELPTAAELESELELEPVEERPALTDLQVKLDSPLHASVVRLLVKANPDLRYRVDNELNLVLPLEGQPPLEHLQWLVGNEATAGRAQRLIERNPDWGFVVHEGGVLRELDF